MSKNIELDPSVLRLDYEKTTEVFKLLADIRFKLLAFIPAVVGATVALTSNSTDLRTPLALGLLGFFATVGILLYELRNSHLYNWASHRAKYIEARLRLPTSVPTEPRLDGDGQTTFWPPNGGVFSERPPTQFLLFGCFKVKHDHGLALVYAAAFAGWTYLIVHSALLLSNRPARIASIVALGMAVACGILFRFEIIRHDEQQKKPQPRVLDEPANGEWPPSTANPSSVLSHSGRSTLGVFTTLVVALAWLSFSMPTEPSVAAAPAAVPPRDEVTKPSSANDEKQKVDTTSQLASQPPARGSLPPESQEIHVPAVAASPAVSGETTLLAPRWMSIAGSAFIVAGVGLWFMRRTWAKVAAASLITIGAITTTGSLIGEFKLDSIVKIEKVPLDISFHRNAPLFGPIGLQRLATFPNFKIGSAELNLEGIDVDKVVESIKKQWADNRDNGKVGALLLVGSTDRLALRRSLQSQFEANVGLARARAEAVKARLLAATESLSVHRITENDVLVLVSGPAETRPSVDRSPFGFPEDRRVDVWALWGSGQAVEMAQNVP